MRKNKIFIIGIVAAGFIAGAILGLDYLRPKPPQRPSAALGEVTSKYWSCAMHPSVKSDKPGKCPICGMDLIAVEKPEPKQQASEQKAGPQERKVLYYRSPMDPSSTSPTPMKDAMGMDYIPVYAEEAVGKEVYYGCGVKEFGHCPKCDEARADAQCICGEHKFIIKGQKMVCPVCKKELKKLSSLETSSIPEEAVGSLSLSQRQQELSGVVTSKVKKENIFKEIRTVGKIAYDPGLTIAQEEFLIALETKDKVANSPDADVVARAGELVEKSKFRLKVLGMSDEQIKELEAGKEAQRNLILPEGKAWVYADVYEYELSWIKEGIPVKVTAQGYPGQEFEGVIKAVNPILDPNTRSAKVRLEIDNPEKKLRPEMFVDVFIQANLGLEALAISREAVLDTGSRKIVWVDKGNGNFEAREIKTGPEGIILSEDAGKIRVFPVLSGLREGEYAVTKGNFLLDSQSQLTSGMSVLWGGSSEVKEEDNLKTQNAPLETQHRH